MCIEEQTTDQCKTTGGETKCETEEIIDHMTETPSLKYSKLHIIVCVGEWLIV